MQQQNILEADAKYDIYLDDAYSGEDINKEEADRVLASQITAWFQSGDANMKSLHVDWKKSLQDFRRIRENAQNYPLNSKLYIPFSYSLVCTFAARLYGFPMKTDVIPITSDSEEAANAAEDMSALMEHMLDKAKIKQLAIDVYMSMGIFTEAIVGTGWEFKEETVKYRKIITDEQGNKILKTDTKKIVTKDQPYLRFINPFNFFIEPGATSIESARWVIERIYVSPEYLRRHKKEIIGIDEEGKPIVSGRYSNVEKAISMANSKRVTKVQELYGEITGSRNVLLYRCWTSNRKCIEIAEESVVVYNGVNQYYHGKKPYVSFKTLGLPGSCHGEGWISPVRDLHKAANDTLNVAIDNGNISVNNVFTVRDTSDLVNEKTIKLYPGRKFNVIDHDDIRPLQIPDSRGATFNQLNTIITFAKETSGSPQVSSAPGQQLSAEGAADMLMLSDGRIALTEMLVDQSWGEVMTQTGSLIQQYISEPQLIPTYKDGGQRIFKRVLPENIIGHNFVYKPMAGSSTWKGEPALRQQLINFLNIAQGLQDVSPDAQTPGNAYPVVNIAELTREIMKRMRIPHPEKFLHNPAEIPPQMLPKQGGMPQGSAGNGTPLQNEGAVISPDQLPTGLNPGDIDRQISATGKEN